MVRDTPVTATEEMETVVRDAQGDKLESNKTTEGINMNNLMEMLQEALKEQSIEDIEKKDKDKEELNKKLESLNENSRKQNETQKQNIEKQIKNNEKDSETLNKKMDSNQ